MNKFTIVLIVICIGLVGSLLFKYLKDCRSPRTPIVRSTAHSAVEGRVDIPNSERAYIISSDDSKVIGFALRGLSIQEFTHTISVDLPRLGDNNFYESWLAKSTSKENDIVSTGVLILSDAEYHLVFQASGDMRDYSNVYITKQDKNNFLFGEIVAEGKF